MSSVSVASALVLKDAPKTDNLEGTSANAAVQNALQQAAPTSSQDTARDELGRAYSILLPYTLLKHKSLEGPGTDSLLMSQRFDNLAPAYQAEDES